MSHSTRVITNKHQKRQKINFQQYLYDSGEPEDYTNNQDNIVQLDDQPEGFYILKKRQIRHDAQRLRARYS